MRIVVAVPARLESSRLPRKVLADIGGKAMLQRVLEQCAKAQRPDDVVLCTDSEELRDIATTWGFRTVMTPASCSSGTDRIAHAAKEIEADVIINVQGDQPFIDPLVIDRVASECVTRNPTPSVLTPIYKLKQDGIHNPNTVKALLKLNGDAIYFSRSAIPSQRDAAPQDWAQHADYWAMLVYMRTPEVCCWTGRTTESQQLRIWRSWNNCDLLKMGSRLEQS